MSSLWERVPPELLRWWTDTMSTRKLQSAAILLLAVLAAVALLAPATTKESNFSDLFEGRNLAPGEVERVEAALGHAGLTAEYRLDAGHVVVPTSRRGEFLSAIREANALPESFHTPMEQAINNSSLIETSRQQSQRLHHALQKEARLAICAMPGVNDASVHFDTASGAAFRGEAKVSAFVGVKTSASRPLDEQSFRAIQAMVLGFKAGLQAENVTVADLTSGNFFRGKMGTADDQSLLAIRRSQLERTWQQKIQSAIPFAKGAILAVNVVPTDDALLAKSVSCSVSVPRSNKSRRIDDVEIKQRIQRAILPLIGSQKEQSSGAVDRLIAVTVFDEVAAEATDARSSRRLIVALLCGGGAIFLVALMLIEPKRAPQEDPEAGLRIFDAKDTGVEVTEHDDEAELRSLAQQDPEAVARSLSDLIDRAS